MMRFLTRRAAHRRALATTRRSTSWTSAIRAAGRRAGSWPGGWGSGPRVVRCTGPVPRDDDPVGGRRAGGDRPHGGAGRAGVLVPRRTGPPRRCSGSGSGSAGRLNRPIGEGMSMEHEGLDPGRLPGGRGGRRAVRRSRPRAGPGSGGRGRDGRRGRCARHPRARAPDRPWSGAHHRDGQPEGRGRQDHVDRQPRCRARRLRPQGAPRRLRPAGRRRRLARHQPERARPHDLQPAHAGRLPRRRRHHVDGRREPRPAARATSTCPLPRCSW